MSVSVLDRPSRRRYEVYDGDQLVGYAEYLLSDDQVAFTHTRVDPAFTERGVARQLVAEALADVRARGRGVLPFCPLVRDVVARNAYIYLDLVPAQERARFDLPTPTSW